MRAHNLAEGEPITSALTVGRDLGERRFLFRIDLHNLHWGTMARDCCGPGGDSRSAAQSSPATYDGAAAAAVPD